MADQTPLKTGFEKWKDGIDKEKLLPNGMLDSMCGSGSRRPTGWTDAAWLDKLGGRVSTGTISRGFDFGLRK